MFHHQHLGTLLDSVLATLALTHESESRRSVTTSLHLLGSCRIASQPATATPASLPAPPTTQLDIPASGASATYADAVIDLQRLAPSTSETKTTVPRAVHRVIIHFDR
ncbi:hypothetical protein B0H19DRAFT_1196391 [Mycena capillaripes]|nr:hypothetical protein B0H19DRAFT_1196391 [Mycena capillaripes]